MKDLEPRLQAALGETYRVRKELGGGGMSRVFLAEGTRPGRQVVIEVLPPEMILATEYFERKRAMARATGRIVSPAASCTADLLLVGGRPR